MEKTTKLKPCKFCGGRGIIRTVPFDAEDYQLFQMHPDIEHEECSFVLECGNCAANTGPIYMMDNAVKVWNDGGAGLVNYKT